MEYFVYGATLEGLLVGSFLHQRGHDVTVFEPSAKHGACFAPVEFRETLIRNILSSLPYDENIFDLLKKITQKLNFISDFRLDNCAPQTFDKGHLEPFVGFGENSPDAIDFLASFRTQEQINILPSLENWIKTIALSGLKIRYQTTVTAIETNNDCITSIVVNDKEVFRPQNLIFALPLKNLPETVDSNLIPPKVLSKISKATFYSSVQLSLVHAKAVTENRSFHFLYGTQKKPTVLVGAFHEKTSQWISLIPSESLDINEEGASVLKEMKRQIKRAYPETFNDIVFEKIALLPETHGYIDLKSKNLDIPLKNLRICSAQLSAANNPLSASLMAVADFIQ